MITVLQTERMMWRQAAISKVNNYDRLRVQLQRQPLLVFLIRYSFQLSKSGSFSDFPEKSILLLPIILELPAC